MSVRDDAQTVINWLCKFERATVGQIAAAGVLVSRRASDAVAYGVRHAALVREGDPPSCVYYRVSGKALPKAKQRTLAGPSFDPLLDAWGIARVPPRLSVPLSRKLDHGE